MSPSSFCRFWQIGPLYGVLLLVFFCAVAAGSEPDRVSLLINQLNDADFHVRAGAADALAGEQDPRAVERLTAVALKDPNSDVRQSAARALGHIGTPAVEPLIAALQDRDSNVQAIAADALGGIKDPRAVEPLIAILKHPFSGSFVRQKAVEALGYIGIPAVERLIAVALKDPNSDVQQSVARALGIIGMPAVERLIAVLNNPSSDSSIREKALEALGRINDPRAVQPLIAALQGSPFFSWEFVARTFKDPRVVKPLIAAALKDPDPFVRGKFAPEALGNIGIPAVEPLIAALKDRDSNVQAIAADALGRIKDLRAVEPLIAVLKNPFVRAKAIEALGAIKDVRAVAPLIAALKDADSNVRPSAAEALGKIKDPRAVGPLMAVLKDKENWESSRQAVAIGALGEIGLPAASALKHLLDDNNDFVRQEAMKALAPIADVSTLPVLIDHLTDWYVSENAAGALARLGWSPATTQQQVHFLIAQREKQTLLSRWGITKPVLLSDITSPVKRVLENALYAGIGLGNPEFISDAIAILDNRGSKEMTEAFLNCGQEDLRKAAQTWAARKGYFITTGTGNAPVTWGRM